MIKGSWFRVWGLGLRA